MVFKEENKKEKMKRKVKGKMIVHCQNKESSVMQRKSGWLDIAYG